jgi:hypothetical protein
MPTTLESMSESSATDDPLLAVARTQRPTIVSEILPRVFFRPSRKILPARTALLVVAQHRRARPSRPR